MALNAFVNQMPKANQAAAILQPGSGTSEASGDNGKTSMDLLARRQQSANSAREVQELVTSATAFAAGNHAIAATALSEGQVAILRGLAALQIKYGQAAEAVPYLMFLRNTNPDDRESNLLLAKALMRLERWNEADIILAELETPQQNHTDDKQYGLVVLYRSIAAFKRRRIAEARSLLSRFRNLISGSQS